MHSEHKCLASGQYIYKRQLKFLVLNILLCSQLLAYNYYIILRLLIFQSVEVI